VNSTNCCASGMLCVSGKCQTVSVGDPCTSNKQCPTPPTAQLPIAGSISMACISNTCQYLYMVGDSCSSNADCHGDYGITCDTHTGKCVGLPLGANCGGGVCNLGLYCKYPPIQCVPKIAEGGKCEYAYECLGGLACTNGACTQPFSLPLNSNCLSNLDCQTNLICGFEKTCVVPSALKQCTSNSQCTESKEDYCLCSKFSGDQFCAVSGSNYWPCPSEGNELFNCLNSYNCTSPSDAPQSCCRLNCYSQFKKALSCNCPLSDAFYGDCIINPFCGGFPVWAIILIVLITICLLVACLALVASFFVYRRRKNHYRALG